MALRCFSDSGGCSGQRMGSMMTTTRGFVRQLLLLISLVLATAAGTLSLQQKQPTSAPVRDIRVLSMAYLTTDGSLLQNDDVLISHYIQPIAMKHFNERNSSIIQEIASVKNCNVRLGFTAGGLQDIGGVTSDAMYKLVTAYNDERVDIIHGPGRSDVAVAVGVTAGALNVPMMSHLVTSDVLSDKRVYPTFFRVIPTSEQYAAVLGSLLQNFGYRKIAILYINDDYGNAIHDALFQFCQTNNIELIASSYQSVPRGSPHQVGALRSALRVIVQERVNVIYYTPGGYEFLEALAIAARSLDWIKGKLWLHQNSLIGDFLANAKNQTVVGEFFHGSVNVFYAFDEANPVWNRFLNAWGTFNVSDVNPYLPNGTTRKGEPLQLSEDYFSLRESQKQGYRYLTVGYDSIIAMGLAACGKDPSMINNMKYLRFQGTSGTVEFGPTQDRLGNTFLSYADNIQVHFVESSSPSNDSVNGSDATAIVTKVRMGVRSNGTWTMLQPSGLVFSDGTDRLPLDIDRPTHVIETLPMAAKIVGWVEASIAMLFGAMSMVYLIRFGKDRKIFKAHPIFMFLLSTGCLLLAGSIVPLTLEGSGACMLFPWLFSVGFTLALASLTAKSIGLAALFNMKQEEDGTGSGNNPDGNPQASPAVSIVEQENRNLMSVSNKQHLALVGGIIVVLLGDIIIMTSWQLVAPMTFDIQTSMNDSDGFPLLSSAICVSGSSTSNAFLATFVSFICVIVLLTMVISFRMRNIIFHFQAVKMTAIASACMFQAFLIGIPAVAAVWNSPLPRFLVTSSVTFLLCLLVLGTIYIPKLLNWRMTSRAAQLHSRFNTGSVSLQQANTNPNNIQCPELDRLINPVGNNGLEIVDPATAHTFDPFAGMDSNHARHRRPSVRSAATLASDRGGSKLFYGASGVVTDAEFGSGSSHVDTSAPFRIGLSNQPILPFGLGLEQSDVQYVPFIDDPAMRIVAAELAATSHMDAQRRFRMELENIKDVDGNDVILQ